MKLHQPQQPPPTPSMASTPESSPTYSPQHPPASHETPGPELLSKDEKDRLVKEFATEFPELEGAEDLDSSLGEILREFLTEFPNNAKWETRRAPDWEKIELELNRMQKIPCPSTIKYEKPERSTLEEYKFKDNFSHLADTLPPNQKQ